MINREINDYNMDKCMESLFNSDYQLRKCNNIGDRIEVDSVKGFIENFIHRSGYGVGNSEIATMLGELADKWDY